MLQDLEGLQFNESTRSTYMQLIKLLKIVFAHENLIWYAAPLVRFWMLLFSSSSGDAPWLVQGDAKVSEM